MRWSLCADVVGVQTNRSAAALTTDSTLAKTSSRRILIFFHVMAMNHVLSVIDTEVSALYYSGLYAQAHAIYVFLAHQTGDPATRKGVTQFFERQGSKFQLVKESDNRTSYERLTLEAMPGMVNDDDVVFYLHSKGVSHKQADRESRRLWTGMMLFWLVYDYEACLAKLQSHDTVGVMYRKQPKPHWSGNFWWATGRHIRRLPVPIGAGYIDPEMWVCTAATVHAMDKDLPPIPHPVYPVVYVDAHTKARPVLM